MQSICFESFQCTRIQFWLQLVSYCLMDFQAFSAYYWIISSTHYLESAFLKDNVYLFQVNQSFSFLQKMLCPFQLLKHTVASASLNFLLKVSSATFIYKSQQQARPTVGHPQVALAKIQGLSQKCLTFLQPMKRQGQILVGTLTQYSQQSEQSNKLAFFNQYIIQNHLIVATNHWFEQVCPPYYCIEQTRFYMKNQSPQQLTIYSSQYWDSLISNMSRLWICNRSDIFLKQTQINSQMRSVLVDWMVEVHHKLRLSDETLYLSVYLLDRSLQEQDCPIKKLQLLGIACLFSAAKYQQIYPPSGKIFVQMTKRTYQLQQIIHTESNIFKRLSYNFNYDSPLRYLEIMAIKLNLQSKDVITANYICHVFLLDKMAQSLPPLHQALAALYLQYFLFGQQPNKTKSIIEEGKTWGIKASQLKEKAKLFCVKLQEYNSSQLSKIREKFSESSKLGVSRLTVSKR